MSERRYEAHPESAPGDFYVVNGECILCGVPHSAAPELMGWAERESHCIWKRPPLTPQEVRQAMNVVLESDVGCHRYAGDDEQVIAELGRQYCDSTAAPPYSNE